jgi:hypothetical protein
MIKQRRYLKKDEKIYLGSYSGYSEFGHFTATFWETENAITYLLRNESIPARSFHLKDLNVAVECVKAKDEITRIVSDLFPDKDALDSYKNNSLVKSGTNIIIEEWFMTSGFQWKLTGYEDGKLRLWCQAFPLLSLPIRFTWKIKDAHLREWVEGIIESNPEWMNFENRTIADDLCMN